VKAAKVVKVAKPAAPKVAAKNLAAKAAVTAKNQKPTPKVAAKKVNEVLKKTAKPEAGKALKAVAPAPAKSKPAPVVKAVAKAAPVVKVAPKAVAKPAPVPVSVAAPVAPTPAAVPAKAGRPSSRLAQLTVPSMAQSVASTAAKSSFTQHTALPLIVPPLASATKKDPKLANNWKTKPVEQMSDAELMAMPDSEYMNEKQMAVFRLKLAVLKQDILNSAGETTEHLREDTVVVPDPADRATIEEEHALELRTRDRERKLLKKIEQSINRIDAGDYGYCDETGEPIGVGRLLARPTATLSLEAQQRRELKQKMFGD
jgi:DnaK suppressor protein